MKKCDVCDKEFEPKNHWQTHCSNSCNQAMWAAKRFTISNFVTFVRANWDIKKLKKELDKWI